MTGVFQFCIVIYLPSIHSTGPSWKGIDKEASAHPWASNSAFAEADSGVMVYRRSNSTVKCDYSGDKSGVSAILLNLS